MDETQLEGNSGDSGDSNANSSSSATPVQPSGANLAETIAQLQKKVNDQQGEINALKGGKDKAVDRVIKAQEQTLAKLAKYLNVDEAALWEAQRQSVLDEVVAERMSGVPSTSSIQGRVGAADESAGSRTVENFSVADAIAEVETYKLSPNDPSFVDLLRKNPGRQQVKDYILERMKPPPPASPAGFVQAPARSGAVEKGVESLTTDYIKEMRAAPRGPSGDAQRREIKNKYITQGVRVHEIDFT